MEIPKFEKECYSLIILESRTGKVLNIDGSYYNSEGTDYYIIKKNMDEIELYVEENLNEDIDISIFDNNGEYFKYYSIINREKE